MKKLLHIIAVLVLLGGASAFGAVTNVWQNGGNLLWTNTANWSLGSLPSSGDTVILPSSVNVGIIDLSGTTQYISSLSVSNMSFGITNGTLGANIISTLADNRNTNFTISANVTDTAGNGLTIINYTLDGGYITINGQINITNTSATALLLTNNIARYSNPQLGTRNSSLTNNVSGGIKIMNKINGGGDNSFWGNWTVGGDFNDVDSVAGGTFIRSNMTVTGSVYNNCISVHSLSLSAGSAVSIGGDLVMNGAAGSSINISQALSNLTGNVYVKNGTLNAAVTNPFPSGATTIYLGDTGGTTNAVIAVTTNYSSAYPYVVQSGSSGTATFKTTIGAGRTFTWSGNITLNKILFLDNITANSTNTISGIISGSGSLVINPTGAGVAELTGTNNYTGFTTLYNGRLNLTATNNLATNTTLSINGVLNANYTGTQVVSRLNIYGTPMAAGTYGSNNTAYITNTGFITALNNPLISATNWIFTNKASPTIMSVGGNWTNELSDGTAPINNTNNVLTFNITGSQTIDNDIYSVPALSAKRINIGGTAGLTLTGNGFNLVDAASGLYVSNTSANVFNHTMPITGVGGLRVNSGGTLNIANTNNIFTGKTIISNATLYADSIWSNGIPSSLGAPINAVSGTIDLYEGATLVRGNLLQLFFVSDRIINLAGSGAKTNTICDRNNDSGLTLTSPMTATGTGSTLLILFCGGIDVVTGDRALMSFNGIPDMSDASQVSLQPTFMMQSGNGPNRITLGGTNTFTGSISLTNAYGVSSLASTPIFNITGTLMNGNYTNTISIGSYCNMTYGNAATNQILSGVISGAGNLTMSGTNQTLTLTAVNTYSGLTAITAGTLEIGSTGQLGAGTYTNIITNSAIFYYNNSATQTLSGPVNGTGMVSVAKGTVILQGSLSGGNYSGSISNNATMILSNSVAQLYIGKIYGNGNIEKRGSDISLINTNTFSGNMKIYTGTVTFSNNACMNSSTIYIYSGGTNNLAFAGNHRVKGLYIDGVMQTTRSAYGASDLPAYITGTGYLYVDDYNVSTKSVLVPGVDDTLKIYNSIFAQ